MSCVRPAKLAVLLIAASALALPEAASAQRGHGGHGVRNAAPSSMHRAPAAHGGGGVNRGAAANRSGNRINTGDVNIRGGDVNINRNVNVNVDNHHGWNSWDDHPVARGVAFGTAAAVTSAVVGSMIYSLPPACAPRPYGSMTYYYCGNVWYQPQYQGSTVTYVVVNAPY